MFPNEATRIVDASHFAQGLIEPLHNAIGLSFYAIIRLAQEGRAMSPSEFEEYLHITGTMILSDVQYRVVRLLTDSFVGDDRPQTSTEQARLIRTLLAIA